jgi:outer membrane protein assembly factor BamB
MNVRTLPLLAACLLAGTVPGRAADWPQWQGPDRDNVSKEIGLLKSWPKEGPKLLWTYPNAGAGFSGPAVVGDRLYILGDRDKTEYVLALDVKSGKEVWAAEVGPYLSNGSTEKYGIGPRSTPTVAGDAIYALGSQGTLVCVSTADGKPVWKVSLPQDLHGQMMSGWGWSESPLVDGDQVVCTPGGKQGTLAALDKKTGKVLWRSADLSHPAAYSSVVIGEAGGVRQYVQLTGQGVVGVAPKDGKLLWGYPGKGFRTAMIPTPIVHGDYVYFTAGYGVGCDLLHLTQQDGTFKVESVYDAGARKAVENKHEAVVLVGDHVYGWTDSERGRWVCQELKTGKIAWDSRDLGRGSVTYADGHLYCYSEKDGTVVLVRASPEGWKEDGRFQIPQQTKIPRKYSPSIWTHPVVAGGHLFLRDEDLLFCFDVKAAGAE